MKKELDELGQAHKKAQAQTLTTLVEIRLGRRPSSKVLRENTLKRAYWQIMLSLEERMTFGELAQTHSFNPGFLVTALENLQSIGKVRDVKRGRGELVVWEHAPKSHDKALDPEKVSYHMEPVYLE